jgi:hypothetical protein
MVLNMMAETNMRYAPLPWFTRLVIFPHGWILACPVPWLIYSSAMTFRREISTSSALIFAGTLFLAASILVCAIVIALVLPYIPHRA